MVLPLDESKILEQTAKQIEFLKAKRARLVHEVEEVDLQIQLTQANYGRLLNQALPISKLPNEILATVFKVCQDSHRHGTALFEFTASKVSSHWRETVLATPLLWSNIVVTVKTHRHDRTPSLEKLVTYLDRSGTCPLDIVMHVTSTRDITPHLCSITCNATRLRRLSMRVTASQASQIYSSLRSMKVPTLEHLSLRVGKVQDDFHLPRSQFSTVQPQILINGAPSLHFVRVSGMALGSLQPPLTAVTTLHLEGWMREYLSFSQFQTILDSLPVLINLSLNRLIIQLPRDPLEDTSPTLLSTLRSLRICGDETPAHRLLSIIILPHLESLILQEVDTFDSVPLPSVKSLTLECCAFSDTEIQNILRAFPGVVCLSIDESVPLIYTMLTPTEADSDSSPERCTWPDLRSLTQRELQPMDVLPLQVMIGKRAAAKSPLAALQLDRRSRSVLRSKGLLDHLPLECGNCDGIDPWPLNLGYDDPDDFWE